MYESFIPVSQKTRSIYVNRVHLGELSLFLTYWNSSGEI